MRYALKFMMKLLVRSVAFTTVVENALLETRVLENHP